MATIFQKITEKLLDDTKKESAQTLERFKRLLAKELVRRAEWERKSYVNVMMKAGFHWVNDQGLPDSRDPNQLRRHVNKFKSTLRGLKNQITFNDPIVDVIPDNGEPVDQSELDLASIIIRSEFDMANNGAGMKSVMKTMVDDGATKSFAFISVMPNNNPEDPQLNDVKIHDPFDVFFDNKDLTEARMVSISSYEDRGFLKEKGYANLGRINDSSDRSHSVLKNEFEELAGKHPDLGRDMILIDSVYYVEEEKAPDEKESDKSEPKKKRKIMNVVFSGDTVIRPPTELKGYKHLGQLFFLYWLESDEHVKYPMPWMSDVVPLQRSLNDASENIDTILHWTAKVRLMQRAGATNTVQLVGDKHVQKIRFSGEKPSFMEMPNPPEALFRVKKEREADIEDMVGVHSSSMGRPSSDRSSGRREAILAAGDADNVAEPVSNLEVALSLIFRQILENAADNVTKVQKFYGDPEDDGVKAIGSEALKKLKDEERAGVVAIRPFKKIRVKIVPGSQMQVAQARNEMFELIGQMAGGDFTEERKILFKTLVRMYNTGMSRDIGKQIDREREEEESLNADVHIARLEIEKLSRAEPVTATPEQPHELHVQLKMLALQEIGETEGPIFDTFMENIGQHDAMLNPATKKNTALDAITG